MAAAGMLNPGERKVSYQAAAETNARPPMFPLPKLSGPLVGAHNANLILNGSNEWFDDDALRHMKELHVSPSPQTNTVHWLISGPTQRIVDPKTPGDLDTSWADNTRLPQVQSGWDGWHCLNAVHRWLTFSRAICTRAGLSQLALHAGATDSGREDITSNDNASTIERHIRMAGFQPCRRNPQWTFEDDSTLRPVESLNRPLRRLDIPSRA